MKVQVTATLFAGALTALVFGALTQYVGPGAAPGPMTTRHALAAAKKEPMTTVAGPSRVARLEPIVVVGRRTETSTVATAPGSVKVAVR